ncbi:glyoxal oxidase N-terminus-domain-containing protein [Mycena olivaceomarginata]|nr:glyoxal oxidase N-terminus-domain-containing protein [Mycena olivaceomarginata]
MIRLGSLLSLAYLLFPGAASPAAPSWKFVLKGNSGIVGLEAIVVSPTLVVMFDRATNDPLHTPDGKVAWAALWNLETNKATPLKLLTDSFCGSGALISNGTMVSVGGNIPAAAFVNETGAYDGRMGLRLFGPCLDPNGEGEGCTIFEDLDNLKLAETRWYTSTARVFDGSIMIVGGTHDKTPFYNVDPVNSFEFFPKKDGGIPRSSAFLERSLPVNLFPRVFALPDGKVFMLANNQTIIYDIEKKTETILPDLPNGQRVSNPFDGTAALLPLSPPLYIPEVLACGGSTKSDTTPVEELSAQDPATSQCARITLSPAGIKKGWVVEHMPHGRMMPEMILLPNGQVLIINGGATGYAATSSIGVTFGTSNAANPIGTPLLYTPSAPLGRRFSQEGLPTTDIPRNIDARISILMRDNILTLKYQSHRPQGNILLAGNNPNRNFTIIPPGQPGFSPELRVQTLNPPFFNQARPTLTNFTIGIDIPAGVPLSSIKARPTTESILRVLPIFFVTVGDTTSVGAHVMVGSGANPPVPDQGIRLPGL